MKTNILLLFLFVPLLTQVVFAQNILYGDNIVVDGEFDQGEFLPPWEVIINAGNAEVSVNEGELSITNLSGQSNDWDIYVFQVLTLDQIEELTKEGNWELTFEARTTPGSTKNFYMTLGEHGGGWERYWVSDNGNGDGDVQVDGEMKTYKLSTSITKTWDSMSIGFFASADANDLFIDNISLRKVEDNIILNGDFSTENDWSFIDLLFDASDGSITNGEFVFTNISGVGNTYDLQAEQALSPEQIDSIYNGPYEVSFEARTSNGTKDVNVFFGELGGNWVSYFGLEDGIITVDTAMTTYKLQTYIEETWSSMRLSFEVNTPGEDLFIDNVVLKRLPLIVPSAPQFNLSAENGVVTISVTDQGAASYDVFFADTAAFNTPENGTFIGTIDPSNGLTLEHSILAPHPTLVYNLSAFYGVVAKSESGTPSEMATESIVTTMGVRKTQIAGLQDNKVNQLLEAFSNDQMPDGATIIDYFPEGYVPFEINQSNNTQVFGSGVDGDSDLSGKFWIGFETISGADFLILYAEVTDDVVNFAPNNGDEGGGAWNYDSWEIGIGAYEPESIINGADHESLETGLEPDYQFRAGLFNDNSTFIFGYNQDLISQTIPNSETIGVITETGYRLLTLLSTKQLSAIQYDNVDFQFPTNSEFTTVPFNIALNDNDDLIRDNLLAWSNRSTISWWNTPSEWEVVAMVGKNEEQNVEEVEVTFTVNTSTLPDTLQEYHSVQLRGGVTGSNSVDSNLGNLITWDSGTLEMNNIGGDYWSVSFDMSSGDTLNYKFWAGKDTSTGLYNGTETGWESGDNNIFILPTNVSADTSVSLQWFETRESPFEIDEDSISVLFRVNVGRLIQTGELDPKTDKVGLRGTPPFFTNPADWSSSTSLEEEAIYDGVNRFFSTIIKFHPGDLSDFDGDIRYKFVIDYQDGEVLWESRDDRIIKIPSSDTTLHWKFFNDEVPAKSIVTSDLKFEVNVGILEGLGLFNSDIGDVVKVRGEFNGWSDLDMIRDSETGIFEGSTSYTEEAGTEVKYKYFILWDESRDDENSINYIDGITFNQSGWEEPASTGGGERLLEIADQPTNSNGLEYFNGIKPNGLLTQDNVMSGEIVVRFNVDMNPATSFAPDPFNSNSDSVYIEFETPFFILTNELPTITRSGGNLSFEEVQKILLLDPDGDNIYSLDLKLQLPTINDIGFRIAYGESPSIGNVFLNGEGFGPGRRYYQFIQPLINQNLEVSWPSFFEFPVVEWRENDLPVEELPDYETPNVDSVFFDAEIELPSLAGLLNKSFIVPVYLNNLGEEAIEGFELSINFDFDLVEISLGDQTGALAQDFSLLSNEVESGKLVISAANATGISEIGTLINLNVNFVGAGISPIVIEDILFNEAPILPISSEFNVVLRRCGDVTGDETVSALDATSVLRHTVFLTPEYPLVGLDSTAADVTGNGDISAFDASWILQYEVGLKSDFGCISLPIKKNPEVVNATWFLDSNNDNNQTAKLDFRSSEFDVYAIQMELDLSEGVSLKGLSDLPGDWTTIQHKMDGKTLVSAYGVTPLENKQVELEFNAESSKGMYTIEAELTLNESIFSSLEKITISEVPQEFDLKQNYPNPFNPSTEIQYSLAESGVVNLSIYNMLGQKVAEIVNSTQEAGNYQVTWNAGSLSSGVYIYRLSTKGNTFTKRMMLIK